MRVLISDNILVEVDDARIVITTLPNKISIVTLSFSNKNWDEPLDYIIGMGGDDEVVIAKIRGQEILRKLMKNGYLDLEEDDIH